MLIAILIIACVELLVLVAIINKVASEKVLDKAVKTIEDVGEKVGQLPLVMSWTDEIRRSTKSIESNVNDIKHSPATNNEQEVIAEFKQIADGIREQNVRLARGINKNTYDVLKLFIDAVESNNANSLSDAIRSAKHMCKQYEVANGEPMDKVPSVIVS